MGAAFQQYMEQLHPSFEQLVNKTPVSILDLPKELPRQCVYLFSEAGRHLYIGRSNNFRTAFASTLSMALNTIRPYSRLG